MESIREASSSSTSSKNVENQTYSICLTGHGTCSSSLSSSSGIRKRNSGRKKFQETRHPIYRGVRQRNGKWVCEMREPNKKSRLWLGTFTCPEMAARAYDAAALAVKGESAILNFPRVSSSQDSPRQMSSSSSSSAEDTDQGSVAVGSSSCRSSLCDTTSEIISADEKDKGLNVYLDEEEIFNMPGLINSLAEGLMLTPPAIHDEFNWDGEDIEDFKLWSD